MLRNDDQFMQTTSGLWIPKSARALRDPQAVQSQQPILSERQEDPEPMQNQKAHWEAQGQPWRRGPEIDIDQDELLPSLDLAFEETKKRIDSQLQQADGLDAKTNFIKGAATGIISLTLVLQVALIPIHSYKTCTSLIPFFVHDLSSPIKRALPLLPILIAYLIVNYTTHQAYKVDEYRVVPEPEKLRPYLQEPIANTKIDMYNEMVEAFKSNQKKINRKAGWILPSLILLNVECALLVILLLFQVIC